MPYDAKTAFPGQTEARAKAGILQSAFHTGCQKLDWRVRLNTAIGFVVTHSFYSTVLKKPLVMSEAFMTLKEAMDFHDAKGESAGVIIAIREDGSVIGEIPTPKQEREIRARAAQRDHEIDVSRTICRLNERIAT